MANNSKRSSRPKKPSTKLKESAEEWATAPNLGDATQKWCKIYCDEDCKTHVVGAKSLEPEDSEVLKISDLQKGNTLLWRVKGKRYTTTLLEVYDFKPLSSNKREHSSTKICSDESESEDEGNLSKKRKFNRIVTKIYGESSGDDDDDNGDDQAVHNTPKEDHVVDNGDVTPTNGQLNAISVVSCTCKEEITKLTKTVLSLQTSLTSIASKVDRVYATMKQSRMLQRHAGASTSLGNASTSSGCASSSSPQSSDFDVKEETDRDSKFISESGVNLLAIRALNPSKYALALMDALFSDDEMGSKCFSCGKRGKKPLLPEEKIKLIEECVDKKYGPGTFLSNEHDINKRCNQKCIDVANKIKRQRAIEGNEAK